MTIPEKEMSNKMRSYSSVFSAPSFSKLIKENDFSFIDSKILRYDSDKLGQNFSTYSEYISFIYNHLRKGYRNEYIYKNTLINEMLIRDYGLKDTIVINEFRVGNSVADTVMFNGTSKVFEIKTELDSDKRLHSQLTDYKRIFNECFIVTHESLTNKYLKADESVGIIELIESSRSLKMRLVRPAKKNMSIDPLAIMRSVRTPEYKSIVKNYYDKLPEMSSFNMFEICTDLISKIPSEDLNTLFIEQIKRRKTNTSDIKSHQKELRQIGIALNLNNKSTNQLTSLLDTCIKI